jgi:hypothetical protein
MAIQCAPFHRFPPLFIIILHIYKSPSKRRSLLNRTHHILFSPVSSSIEKHKQTQHNHSRPHEWMVDWPSFFCRFAISFSHRWFYGDFSLDETVYFLSDEPIGTFLLRFSTSQPCTFTVSVVRQEGIMHYRLEVHTNTNTNTHTHTRSSHTRHQLTLAFNLFVSVFPFG